MFSSNLKNIITAINIIMKLTMFVKDWFHLNCLIKNLLKSAYQKIAMKIAAINPKRVKTSAIMPLFNPRKILNRIITRINKSIQLIISYNPPYFLSVLIFLNQP